MSGNGTSANLSESTSTPSFSSDALIVTSQMFFRVFTAIVLPSRSLAVLTGPSFGTSRSAQASFSVARPSTPWLMIWTGRSLDAAISSEIVFEKPIWKSPLSTAGVIAAPPSASCGSIVSFSSLKKPLLHPQVEGRHVGDRDDADLQGRRSPAPPPPPSSSPQPAATAATHVNATSSNNPRLAQLIRLSSIGGPAEKARASSPTFPRSKKTNNLICFTTGWRLISVFVRPVVLVFDGAHGSRRGKT